MGVTGLWNVLDPGARPVRLEALAKKRLAVDASIWIYQFLKAVRDKEGNVLRNSHIVGFFRRICKLLFHGIKPVFVFDGGAPALKRQTLRNRKALREGGRVDVVKTAGKILAVQMRKRALEEAERQRQTRLVGDGEVAVPENPVYFNEIELPQAEVRKFKKQDQYHLPDLAVGIDRQGSVNDPRVMSHDELRAYAEQFDNAEDMSVLDFSRIDYDSEFFTSLPAADQYSILNAARLRSRLRMGLSVEQLTDMFPDRMAFSRFQIERAKERSDLTNRLMNINGMNEVGAQRIASERGREYILVKNDGVDGGWSLGVVNTADRPIEIDKETIKVEIQDDSDGEFEDVPLAGAARSGKIAGLKRQLTTDEIIKRALEQTRAAQLSSTRSEARTTSSHDRRAFQPHRASRIAASPSKPRASTTFAEDGVPLFSTEDTEDAEFEDVATTNPPASAFGRHFSVDDGGEDDEEQQLQRAIQLSMQTPAAIDETGGGFVLEDDDEYESDADPQPPTGADAMQATAADSSVQLGESDVDVGEPEKPQRPLDQIRKAMQANLDAERSEIGDVADGEMRQVRKAIGQKAAHGSASSPGAAAAAAEKANPAVPSWFSEEIRRPEKLSSVAPPRKPEDVEQVDLTADDPDADADDVDDAGVSRKARFVSRLPPGPRLLHEESKAISIGSPERSQSQLTGEPIEIDDEDVEESDDHTEVGVADSRRSAVSDDEAAERISHEPAIEPIAEDASVQASVSDRAADEDDEEADFEDVALTEPVPNVPSMRTDAQPIEAHAQDPQVVSAQEVAKTTTPEPAPPVGSPDWSEIEESDEEDAAAEPAEEQPPLDEEDEARLQEEQELLERVQAEAREYARFSRELANKTTADGNEAYTSADYENDLKQLKDEQRKNLRDSDEVTQVMVQECQELLAHFGIPYIVAPQEAEAQCAELVRLELVDGIVTDDSDVFLFGGTRVYKNMFNAAKTVECFVLSDLEREFELDREKLIQLAYLLGSDYTDGIKKIGPVTAIELISEFAGEHGLHAFKDWVDRVQTFDETDADRARPFRRKFRKTAEKLVLPDNFPNPLVREAYVKPEVDRDPSAFAWGQPDLDALRGYLMRQIGWTQDRTDEQLLPVVRDMYRKQTEGSQRNLTDFFAGAVGTGGRQGVLKPIGSTRLHNALSSLKRGHRAIEADGIGGGDDDAQEAPQQKRSVRSKKANSLTKPIGAALASKKRGKTGKGKKKAQSSTTDQADAEVDAQAITIESDDFDDTDDEYA